MLGLTSPWDVATARWDHVPWRRDGQSENPDACLGDGVLILNAKEILVHER